ncbi:MAG: hypothetical protein ACI9BD_000863, partial [Candidatus Marinamargulisbacteria bacterium]
FLCDFYVGPDTGPTHLASFLNKPILFFSPTKPNPPTRWGPQSDYFRIIRKDYACRYLCVKKCHPDECFAYLTGKRLSEEFDLLQAEVKKKPPHSDKSRRQYLMIHSYRILYVIKSEVDFVTAEPYIKELRSQGLQIFPFLLGGKSGFRISSLIKAVIHHNINIVQGPCPVWMRFLIRFVMGPILQYVQPIFVPYKIHEHILFKEYMRIYENEWQKDHLQNTYY